jgi:acetyl esterase/lipase
MPRWSILMLLAVVSLVPNWCFGQAPEFDRKTDVVYGRKYGMALTMDVFTPKDNPNYSEHGPAVIWIVSGGWYSDHGWISSGPIEEFLKRGYTVFAVVHGSQPRYTIPEITKDLNRAVRFIRYHAKDYQIDPDRIGVTGGSAGGHLSLMQGTAGDLGDKNAKDPIDQVSSRVQAVGCFFPPTDFLNYGKPGENAVGRGILKDFKAPFDFQELDPATKAFREISDEKRITEIAHQISPAYHATADDPPTLIIHGDADTLVPIQQAELILEKLKAAGVETKLVVKKGAGHGWGDFFKDNVFIADWFDAHLKPKAHVKAKAAARDAGRGKAIRAVGAYSYPDEVRTRLPKAMVAKFQD